MVATLARAWENREPTHHFGKCLSNLRNRKRRDAEGAEKVLCVSKKYFAAIDTVATK